MSTSALPALSPKPTPPSAVNAPIALLVPGFLTQTHTLLPNDLDPTRALDARAWVLEATKAIPEGVSARVECFEWGSKKLMEVLKDMLLPLLKSVDFRPERLLKSALNLKNAWHSAEEEADKSAPRLLAHLRALRAAHPSAPIYVIAHSLGGRMAIRACEQMAREGEPISDLYVSTLAAAIDKRAVDWARLAALPSPPEVVFSAHDQVLKYLFKLATATITGIPFIDLPVITMAYLKGPDAAGLVGPGDDYPKGLALDVSDSHIGHLAYLSELPAIFAKSRYLKALLG